MAASRAAGRLNKKEVVFIDYKILYAKLLAGE